MGAAGAALVVIGAAGGYEAGVLAALWAAGQAVALVPAQRVRHFARADGQLAKTARIDARIDARILALFAARMRPGCGLCRPRPLRKVAGFSRVWSRVAGFWWRRGRTG